ncbi:MAG: hypothetical protein IT347_03310 [Candidatus Eisenbacteria bacterium]|nr:hypothetical protein [Candidatus Eisenbacteria bacterium]
MILALAWLLVTGALLAPPLDPYLDGVMVRVVLIQVPLLLVLGALVGRRTPDAAARRWDPAGFTGLAFAAGALVFWMLPRSLDEAARSEVMDQLRHLSLLAAGFGLGAGWRRLPFAARGGASILTVAMLGAMGVFYSRYDALVCGWFTLAQQREAGAAMLRASGLALVAFAALLVLTLAREHREQRRALAADSSS